MEFYNHIGKKYYNTKQLMQIHYNKIQYGQRIYMNDAKTKNQRDCLNEEGLHEQHNHSTDQTFDMLMVWSLYRGGLVYLLGGGPHVKLLDQI